MEEQVRERKVYGSENKSTVFLHLQALNELDTIKGNIMINYRFMEGKVGVWMLEQ